MCGADLTGAMNERKLPCLSDFLIGISPNSLSSSTINFHPPNSSASARNLNTPPPNSLKRQRPDDFEEAASCQWAFCTKQFSSIDELLPHVSTSHLSGNRCSSKVRVTPTFTNTSESSSSRIVQSTENSNNSRINIKFNKSIPTEIITKIDSPNKSETLSSHSACTHPFDYDTYDIRNFNTLATAPPSAFVHACKWALCTLSNFTSVDDLFNHLCTDHLTFSISGPKKNAKNENQQTGEFTGIESQREQQGTESQEQNQRDELFSFSLRRTNSGEFRVEGERGNEGMTMGYDGQQEINEDLEIGQQQTNVKQTQPNQYIAGPHGCLWHGCQDRFDSFDKLTIHVSEFHIGTGKSQYVCEWKHCGREGRPFPQRQKVMRHIQTHTGDKPFECVNCNQRFSEQSVMMQHQRTHTGEKPYKCPEPECGQNFAIPGALTIHIRKHTGEKPFRCKVEGCEMRFAASSNLTKHLRVHTGEKPFQCPECSKRFARPDQVARHQKTHKKGN